MILALCIFIVIYILDFFWMNGKPAIFWSAELGGDPTFIGASANIAAIGTW